MTQTPLPDNVANNRRTNPVNTDSGLLAAIVNASDDAILSKTLDGIITTWNAGAERIFGYTAEEIVGKPKTLLCPPDRLPEVTLILQRLKNGLSTSHLETVRRHKDGTPVQVSLTISPIKDDDGRVTGGATIARDITQRKTAASEVQQSHDRMASLIAAIPDIIFRVDREGICLDNFGSKKTHAIVTTDKAVGRSHRDFVPPHVGDIIQSGIDAAFATGKTQSLQYQFNLNGALRYRDARVVVQSDNAALVVVRDITDSKLMEQALRESEERFRAVYENSAVGITQATPDGRLIQCNPAYAQMLGYSQQELQGISYARITHPDDMEQSRILYQELLEGKRDSYSVEKRYIRKDGGILWSQLNASAVRNADGTLWFVIAVIIDLTERKRTESQLLQAQKMESIGRLAGGIAHDYNNLLAIILGYAEVVEDGLAPDSDLLVSLHNIQGAARRAATVTRQLLSFARRQPSQIQVLAPNDLLATFLELLQPLLTCDITTLFLPGEQVGCVEIDPGHLEQIIMNLAVNARDAMPDGGNLVLKTENVVSTEPCMTRWVTVGSGNYVRITVTDSGRGMTEEVKQRIFEPFFTTKEKGKGTGLGLATVYGLIKQARGYIFVYSQIGMGTTFDIYIPAVQIPQIAPPAPETPTTSPGTETILVVEDEPMIRQLTVQTLRKEGYTVLTAENGIQAVEIFTAHVGAISLVVTDAIMPEMGGRELVERLHTLQPDLPVLMASGYSEEGYAAQRALPDSVRFLQKPFTTTALIEHIHAILATKA